MKRSSIHGAVALALGPVSFSANAALTTSTVLEFDAGVKTCIIGGTFPNCTHNLANVASGSYFGMDTTGSGFITGNEKIIISMNEGIQIGVAQPASGSHPGAPDGSETPGIDNPWQNFLYTGMHFTSSPVTVTNDNGTQKDLDFSGWSLNWLGIPAVNLGGGLQDCGTATDGKCVDNSGNDIGGTYDNGTGIASITCSMASCSSSSSFTLTYAATVPQADPSNFGGVDYILYLEGHVGIVPVPAAAWLFGSGLMGLVGVARRRKVRA